MNGQRYDCMGVHVSCIKWAATHHAFCFTCMEHYTSQMLFFFFIFTNSLSKPNGSICRHCMIATLHQHLQATMQHDSLLTHFKGLLRTKRLSTKQKKKKILFIHTLSVPVSNQNSNVQAGFFVPFFA